MITAIVANLGTELQDSFDLLYYVDGSLVESVLVEDTIYSGGALDYTFGQTYNFDNAGDYYVTVVFIILKLIDSKDFTISLD